VPPIGKALSHVQQPPPQSLPHAETTVPAVLTAESLALIAPLEHGRSLTRLGFRVPRSATIKVDLGCTVETRELRKARVVAVGHDACATAVAWERSSSSSSNNNDQHRCLLPCTKAAP